MISFLNYVMLFWHENQREIIGVNKISNESFVEITINLIIKMLISFCPVNNPDLRQVTKTLSKEEPQHL